MNTPTRHRHAADIVFYAAQLASGEAQAGWWRWEAQLSNSSTWENTTTPLWSTSHAYRCFMTDKHPNYQPPKPKLKLIDMEKLPKGSVVCHKAAPSKSLTVWGYDAGVMVMHRDDDGVFVYSREIGDLRIAEQKTFTYWGGGECPVPDGLKVEFVFRRGNVFVCRADPDGSPYWGSCPPQSRDAEVIAYRIIGVAPGWTDDPKDAQCQ